MNKKNVVLGCACLLGLFASAQSKEVQTKENDSLQKRNQLKEVVVIGTRFEVPVEQSGKTIYKITAAELEKNAGKSVGAILNEVPGIQIDGINGAPGANMSVYARGGRNKDALILIDGVPLNDPSGINAAYDLRLLPLSQIESIEILKGGLSTLYGTGASSAVISIKLKNPKGDALNANVDLNYGSYNTSKVSANVQGKSKDLSYLLSGNYSKSEGISSASDENSETPFGKDGFDTKNVLLKLGYAVDNDFNIEGVVAYDNFEADYDAAAFFDGENVQKGNMLRVGLTPSFKYDKGTVKLKLNYALNSREFISDYPSSYDGRNLQVDLSNTHKLSKNITGLWGVNVQSFSYEQKDVIDFNDSKFSSVDSYASFFYNHPEGLSIHLGARLNTHSEYNSNLIYNINPSYLINVSEAVKIKLLSSLSSAFITPTGYQLFSAYGNTDLNPEESVNFEVGSAFYLNKSVALNFAYFYRIEENVIDFVSKFDAMGNWLGGAYDNLHSLRRVEGVELDLTYKVCDKLSLAANYTHAEADDPTTFYRIPQDKYGLSANITPGKNTDISLKYNFTGERTTFDFASYSEIDLDSYDLFDIYVQHSIKDGKIVAYGALNNALDTDYVSVYGFTTRGRNFNVGLRYNF